MLQYAYTVNAYEGCAGIHPRMWARHMRAFLKGNNVTVECCSDPNKLKEMQEEAKGLRAEACNR